LLIDQDERVAILAISVALVVILFIASYFISGSSDGGRGRRPAVRLSGLSYGPGLQDVGDAGEDRAPLKHH
jgi:hypothetical protein